MALVLALALGLLLLGSVLKLPWSARGLMLGLLYVGVLGSLVILPPDAALRAALGGSAGEWLALGAVGAVAAIYAFGLRRLRQRVRPENRAQPVAEPSPDAPLSPAEVERYARHIVLREIGGPGQRNLKRARVLVVGAGGLGAPVLQYLAAAGVGTIGVIDDDEVSVSNLQRQVIHSEATLGLPKVFSAERAMKALNPHVVVHPYHRRLEAGTAAALVAEYDLVLDGTDNFETRYLVNRACAEAGVPLIAAAIAQWEGQIGLYDPARGGPCYQCIFPEIPAEGLAPSCAEAGVVGPLPGIMGSMMALEAIKHLSGAGRGLMGRLLVFDGLFGETRTITVSRRADCPVCGNPDHDTTPASGLERTQR